MTPRRAAIPIIEPIALLNDPDAPRGSPKPILELKELVVDSLRYKEWKRLIRKKQQEEKERATYVESHCLHSSPLPASDRES